MIIIKLKGGLGNQLFQYAIGRQLSRKNNTELKFDIGFYKNHKYRQFDLKYFNIVGTIANSLDIGKLKFLNLFDFSKPYYKRHVIEEPNFTFNSELNNIGDNTYLDGYWQSEKYFEDSEDLIRNELTLKNEQGKDYEEILSNMKISNSVSIHIRRTDYLSPKNKNIYAICTPDYYDQAVRIIAEKVSNLKLFVFSDDIEWVKKNIPLPHPTQYISSEEKSPANDCKELILMSTCKHNITANSTYSWWGAWLNNNPQKIVITPKKWFLVSSLSEKDLLPNEWIKI